MYPTRKNHRYMVFHISYRVHMVDANVFLVSIMDLRISDMLKNIVRITLSIMPNHEAYVSRFFVTRGAVTDIHRLSQKNILVYGKYHSYDLPSIRQFTGSTILGFFVSQKWLDWQSVIISQKKTFLVFRYGETSFILIVINMKELNLVLPWIFCGQLVRQD